MILKIQDTTYCDQPWVLIDKIREIIIHGLFTLKKYESKDDGDKSLSGYDGQYIPVDKENNYYFPSRIYYKNNLDLSNCCTFVNITFNDGSEKSIAFVGFGYLLNDEGKTVEKL